MNNKLNNNTNIVKIDLEYSEFKIITDLANEIRANPSQDPDTFCLQSKDKSKYIPVRIRLILINFALQYEKNKDLTVIINIPIDSNNIPLTPIGNNLKVGESTLLSKIQSIFINVIGEMISYEAEGYGRLFQDIIPTKNMEKNQTSTGSNVELEIHTEQAFSELRPDFISLACLRGDKEAFTYILHVNTILENLNKEEINLLWQPLWKIGVDLSFKLNNNNFIEGDIRGPISILYGSKDNPQLIFDQDLMTGITEESNNIIKKIINIYYNHRIGYNLKSGDIILINNRNTVHGRSIFNPKYDGYDRFLIRCFATRNYKKTSYARLEGGRTVAAIYS